MEGVIIASSALFPASLSRERLGGRKNPSRPRLHSLSTASPLSELAGESLFLLSVSTRPSVGEAAEDHASEVVMAKRCGGAPQGGSAIRAGCGAGLSGGGGAAKR